MLSEQDFLLWCEKLKVSDSAENLIRQVRSSPPSRAVRSGRGNVSGRYPSRKLGCTIQFESHKVELARIYELEHDPDVLEYYDQPPPIKLNYEGRNGRQLGLVYTPDFFVIRTSSAGWEECKSEERLRELSVHNASRYHCDDEGVWHCPPGDDYARQYGLSFSVWSSKDINWTLYRNIEFLDDYFRADVPLVSEPARASVVAWVGQEPGLSLHELLTRTEGSATRDDVFMLIAHDALYVDLYAVPLVETERVEVFPDRETAVAHANLRQATASPTSLAPRAISLCAGSFIEWDGASWKIVNAGETTIGLLGEGETFTEVPRRAFERLVIEGRITGIRFDEVPDTHLEVKRRLATATAADFAEANRRVAAVRARLQDEPLPPDVSVDERTVRRWVARYRAAEQSYDNGYVGLIPQPKRGNENKRLPPASYALLNDFIANDYETLKQKRKFEVYGAYLLACRERGVMAASYKTFCKVVKQRPRFEQVLKRQGRRAAYRFEEFYWELELTTPRHGERPFHIAHVDHTEADVEMTDSITGANLGRPWVTLLTDAYSRRTLAAYLTFDPPSYRSCMMVMRECVRRFGRLPQIVVTDGGLEFGGVYFETLLARYDATKKTRPPAKARFGSVVERLFGTTNTRFFHNLRGNTQIMRNVRQVTKSVNPKGLAVWTLDKLYEYLCEYLYEVYDKVVHPSLGVTPREAFAAGMVRGGERLHKQIPYNEEFRLFTLPTTRNGMAKVQSTNGVKINHIYYWSDSFRHPEVEGTRIPIRFDPWDMGHAFAFVQGQWIECISEQYAVFHNRSEREVMLATQQLRQRHKTNRQKFDATALKLARFLESAEAEEALLAQRLTDREARGVWMVINGGIGYSALSSSQLPAAVEGDADVADDYRPQVLQMYENF
jgi:transposase InsO family protein